MSTDQDEPLEEDRVIRLQDAIDNDDVSAAKDLLSEHFSLAHEELESGFTPWENTKLSSEAMILAFLDAGVDIDWQDAQGRTLAHFCAEDGVMDTLVILMNHGADLTVHDNDDLGLLDYAIRGKQPETTGFLLGQGCAWRTSSMQFLPEGDAAASRCRDLLLADLSRTEARMVIDGIADSNGPHP